MIIAPWNHTFKIPVFSKYNMYGVIIVCWITGQQKTDVCFVAMLSVWTATFCFYKFLLMRKHFMSKIIIAIWISVLQNLIKCACCFTVSHSEQFIKNRFHIWIIGLHEKHEMLWSKIHDLCHMYLASLEMHQINKVFPNNASLTRFYYIPNMKLSRRLLLKNTRLTSFFQAKCEGSLCLY